MLQRVVTSARHGLGDTKSVQLHVGDTGQNQLSGDFAAINDHV